MPSVVSIREWLLRPERDVAVIRDRHDTVEAFLAPDSVALVDSLKAAVRHIRFMPVLADSNSCLGGNFSRTANGVARVVALLQAIVSRLQQGKASVGDWQAMFKVRQPAQRNPTHAMYKICAPHAWSKGG